MNNLSVLIKQSTIKSTELADIINEFRKQEGNNTELQHKEFYDKNQERSRNVEKSTFRR